MPCALTRPCTGGHKRRWRATSGSGDGNVKHMTKFYLLIIILGALGCSSKESVYYGKLPCASMLTEYKGAISNIQKKLSNLNDEEIKKFISNENEKLLRFDAEIFNCVWLIHQKNRAAYSKEDRDTIMSFSSSYGRIQSANKVFLKSENESPVSLKFLKYNYSTEAEALNKTSQNRPSGWTR